MQGCGFWELWELGREGAEDYRIEVQLDVYQGLILYWVASCLGARRITAQKYAERDPSLVSDT